MRTRFKNREEAGQELATRLSHLAGTDATVLALRRGGVMDRDVRSILAREITARSDGVVESGAQWTSGDGAGGDEEC